MNIKVKTQDDRIFNISLSENALVSTIKNEIERQDMSLTASRHRLLYQGRFLNDDHDISSTGVCDGHMLILVPKPNTSQRQRNRQYCQYHQYYNFNNQQEQENSSLINQLTPNDIQSHLNNRIPDEVVQFIHSQRQVLALIQQSQRRQNNNPSDDQIDFMENQDIDWDNVVNVREGDNSDMILGFAFGFLLGPIAGLCLIESVLSRHLRAGMFVGIICEVLLALLKMATNVPKGV